jgi:iron complex outermembrane recepter protein
MSAKHEERSLRVPSTVSALAMILALSGTAYGQDSQNSEPELEVLVTGRRQALENASDRKKKAESIIDSVVADEAGMLPDNSVTEVLQRVAGVAIVRFGSLGDPDHFSAEGTGVQVRGLSGVASRLNGREIFSASGGRGLSWSDVTPELMAAVDVYKSSTADLIEGGTGGQIDLRTKMPFDFSQRAFQVSLNGNYGDLRKETKPGASLLYSDRFETGIGQFGALVDVAYNQYSSNSDFFRMEPYYKTMVADQARFIPGGYDYGDRNFDRTRKGLYVGLQWAPTESLVISQTAFVSRYEDRNLESSLFVVSKDLTVDPLANTVFDSNGVLVSTSDIYLRDNATFGRSSGVINSGGNTGVSNGTSTTRDYATSFSWQPEGPWSIKGAFQLVNSTSARDDYNLFPGVPFPGSFGLDLTGDLPQVTVPSSLATTLADPSVYEWQASMDHMERNRGTLYAGNLDFAYDFEGEQFFRGVEFGARYAERSERDNNNGYNWTALGRGWNGQPQLHFSDARSGDYEQRVLENFFRGDANLPGNTLMPSYALVSRYDVVGDHNYYGGLPVQPIAFAPFDLSLNKTDTAAAYGLLRFDGGERKLFGIAYKGNVGARLVRIENESSGFFHQNATAFVRDGEVMAIDTSEQTRAGGRNFTRLLPSINFTLLPVETVQVRFGYNITLDQPSFLALRASGELGVRTTGTGTPDFDGFTTESGNPNLRPVISNNTDIAAEWYASRSLTAHMSLFHKSIQNWIVYGAVNQVVPVNYIAPTSQTVNELAQSSNYFNATETATVKGIEIGGRKFFDQLPAPFDGLGVEGNYTYIDSKNPGDRYVDINGVEHFDAPVQGLSRNNYNVTGMYERGQLSVRLAYSWRSEYLMSTNSNGTNGDYTFYSAPGVGTFTDISLPVYSDAYGSLDFGTTWRPSDHLALSLEISNLTNEIAKTLQGGYPNGAKYPRSWFMSDRRANLSLRYNF